MKKKNKAKKEKNGKNIQWLDDLRYGRSLSVAFFSKNAWLLILILVAVIVLIGMRYKTKTKMMEIKSLTVQLERSECRMLEEKARYMTLIRETEMRRLVEQKGLGLAFREQPPYEIIRQQTNE